MDERILTIEFEADFRNVDIARPALQGIAAEYFGSKSESASDVIMAATEAMNNVVEHTSTSTVKVEVGWDETTLRIFVISDGPPFDPVAAATTLDNEDMLERDEGGYGLYLIRELVDRFDYEYRNGRNIWKLYKSKAL